MSARLTQAPFDAPLARRLAEPRQPGATFYWLGQAGFVIDIGRHRLVIDPYLSDTLGKKYFQSPFPHTRMMPAPIAVEDLRGIDLVLCTHQHTDHMDPGTLAPLAASHPQLRFVVPRACLSQARERIGVADDRLVALDAGDRAEPLPGLNIHAVRAAHETLERDEGGRHRFLGYVIEAEGLRLFHSGDCIPFDGQREEIASFDIDLGLLPVNGRSDQLRQAGFAGNFSLTEALALCEACGIPAMLAHHYGMFAFNTADPSVIDAAASAAPLQLVRAETKVAYRLAFG